VYSVHTTHVQYLYSEHLQSDEEEECVHCTHYACMYSKHLDMYCIYYFYCTHVSYSHVHIYTYILYTLYMCMCIVYISKDYLYFTN